MLRPVSRIADQYKLWDNMWNDEYVRQYRMFDKWVVDALPLPAEYMRQFVKDLLIGNKLVKDELVLAGKTVRLGAIKVPVMHAVAEHDHLTPKGATHPLIEGVGSKDKEEVVIKGGHISVATGPKAATRLWPKLEDWLGRRSE